MISHERQRVSWIRGYWSRGMLLTGGISPTVSEASRGALMEPSRTVGLVPRICGRLFRRHRTAQVVKFLANE